MIHHFLVLKVYIKIIENKNSWLDTFTINHILSKIVEQDIKNIKIYSPNYLCFGIAGNYDQKFSVTQHMYRNVNKTDGHWVTISNLFSLQATITIYDSMARSDNIAILLNSKQIQSALTTLRDNMNIKKVVIPFLDQEWYGMVS